MFIYKYPHPAVTSDSVVFGFDGHELHVLLIERGIEPFEGMWALPGGFMKMDETIEECAKRELFEETGVSDLFLEQFHVFSDISRDPRERVVTVAFMALVRESDYRLIAGDDAARASWFALDELPPLAFDHLEIIKHAREHLPVMLRTRPIAFKLLDTMFSMPELQRLYEAINDTKYDRRNFAKKMASTGYLHSVDVAECSTHGFSDQSSDSVIEVKESIQAPVSTIKRRKGIKLYSFDENTFNEDSKKEPPGRNPLLDI